MYTNCVFCFLEEDIQLQLKESEVDEWNPLSNIKSAKSDGPIGASS